MSLSQAPHANHVLIVGSGASGLSLAAELCRLHRDNASSSNKLNITLLEASSIVGGRVRTIRTTCKDGTSSKFLSLTPSHHKYWKQRYDKFRPWSIPLGAEFVHGNENNPTIMEMVHCNQQQVDTPGDRMLAVNDWEMELVFDQSKKSPNLTIFVDNQCFSWYNGKSIAPKIPNSSMWNSSYIDKAKLLWDEILAYDQTKQDMTLEEYVHNRYSGFTCNEHEEKHVLSILNAVYAVTAGSVSNLLGIKEISRQENMWPYGDKNFRLGGCYSELVDGLLIKLESMNNNPNITVDIIMESAVQQISVKPGSKSVQVLCYNQLSYDCDRIGVTVPLATLKANVLQFTGDCAITEQKQDAAKAINVLPGGKVHALLKWGVDLKAFHQIDEESLRGIFVCPEEQFKQIWFRLDESSILVTGFCVFSGQTNDEREQSYLEASLKSLTIRVLSQSMTDKIFHRDCNDDPMLTFSAFDIYDWSADVYVKGMYSSPSVSLGSSAAKSPYLYLSEPISNCLYFAGEHTHTETCATVQSALESGIRAAREIYQDLLAKS